MAYYVLSNTLKKTWKILTTTKIDVRTEDGKFELEELKDSNDFVKEINYNDVNNKCFALVDGKFYVINKLATLKYMLVQHAVSTQMDELQLAHLLKPRKSKARKEFLMSVGLIKEKGDKDNTS